MKKQLITLIIFCLVLSGAKAQNPLSDDGHQFKLASGYNIKGIPLYVSYEMGVLENITFGLEYSFRAYNESTDTADYAHSISGFSFFSNYYFNQLLNLPDDKWFIYAGLNIGYYKWFSPDGYFKAGESSSTLAIGAQIGGAFYFSDWGVFLEGTGGTENAGAKLGVIYRLPY